MKNNDVNSLAHTKWNCKYHIVFAPKYRRQVFLRREEIGNKRDTSEIMSMERSRNYRGRSVSRSYTYDGGNPAQNEHFGIYGLFKRKKCAANISKMGKYKICIPKS